MIVATLLPGVERGSTLLLVLLHPVIAPRRPVAVHGRSRQAAVPGTAGRARWT
jgi:hypothetical protein